MPVKALTAEEVQKVIDRLEKNHKFARSLYNRHTDPYAPSKAYGSAEAGLEIAINQLKGDYPI